jgi:hypothetical protein
MINIHHIPSEDLRRVYAYSSQFYREPLAGIMEAARECLDGNQINERQYDNLARRFPFPEYGVEPQSLKSVGQSYGVSVEAIRHGEFKASHALINKIRGKNRDIRPHDEMRESIDRTLAGLKRAADNA